MVEYAYKENGVLNLKPIALSLSQADIDEIATELLEAMQPDWQSAVSLTISQLYNGYTAPASGMLVGAIEPSTSSQMNELTVNGVIVSEGYKSTSQTTMLNFQVLVNKGDVVKYDVNGQQTGNFSFVPFKTMNPVSLRPLDPHKIDTAILNHWDDITSDFSTAGSSNMAIDSAKYNPVLRKLRIKCHNTTSQASGSGRAFVLTYNGSDLPAFTDSCIYTGSKIQTSDVAGFEFSAWIKQANQVSFYIYNRMNSAWPTGSYTNIQVEF